MTAVETTLRRAVLDRLTMLDDLAGRPDAGSVLPEEIRRVTDGLRELLIEHEPDAGGRCLVCSGVLRRRRWPCPVWVAAHHYLIGEGLPHQQRRRPLRTPFRGARDVQVIPRTSPVAMQEVPGAAAQARSAAPRIHRATVAERPVPLPPSRAGHHRDG